METLFLCLLVLCAFYIYLRHARSQQEEVTRAILHRIGGQSGGRIEAYIDRTPVVPTTSMPLKRQWEFIRTLREQGLISLEYLPPHERKHKNDQYKVILRLMEKGRLELKDLRAKTAPPLVRVARR